MNTTCCYAVVGSDLVRLPVAEECTDIHAILADAPPGIYSAWRSFERRFLRLHEHLERCRRGVVRAGYRTCIDERALLRAIDAAARSYPGGDFRVRLDLLEHPVEYHGTVTNVLMALAPHAPVPEAILEQGASLDYAPRGLQRKAPEIKFTDWVHARRVCENAEGQAYEYLLLDDEGHVLEGISSNFFVLSDGAVVTSGDGVLEGITRQIVFELVEGLGVPVQRRRPTPRDLANADEAFITSATRGVVPVSSVAGSAIGSGKPGPFVERLRARYLAQVEAEAAPVGV